MSKTRNQTAPEVTAKDSEMPIREQIAAGRDENGVPPVVGLGDGTITSAGKFVPELSEEDTERLRAIMGQQNVTALPDGGVMVTVKVDADMVLILREWALGADESFESYVQRQVEIGLQATVMGSNVG